MSNVVAELDHVPGFREPQFLRAMTAATGHHLSDRRARISDTADIADIRQSGHTAEACQARKGPCGNVMCLIVS